MSKPKAIAKPAAAPRAANVKATRTAASGAFVQAEAAAPAAREGVTIVDSMQLYRFDPQARIAMNGKAYQRR